MSTAKSDASSGSVDMLPGVRHYETAGFANTWEAYDALTEADGWRRTSWKGSEWKRATLDGCNLTVHAPTFKRGESGPSEVIA